MSIAHKHYEVGERIYHEDYGVGMVVEVRPRPFFDILAVAFADGVRRLNSNHPKVSEPPAGTPPVRPSDRAGASAGDTRHRAAPRSKSARAHEARPAAPADPGEETPAGSGAIEAELVPAEAEAHVVLAATELEGLQVRPDSLARILELETAPADGGDAFLHHLHAARLSLTHGFRDLLGLSAVQDLERYDFQMQACLRVLRQMHGRAILADEVGLGKTIEAGLILKEYVTRGLVRRALVLTPVSLMSQWREELSHKFELPFEVRARGEGWDAHPFLIASVDTAKTERHRAEIGRAGFDLLIVDEAHRLRNHLTQGWKFVDALSLKYLLLLTATPVQNDLRELYNLVTLLKPGLLGTYRTFRKEYMVRGDKRLPKNTQALARTLSKVMVRTSRSATGLPFPKREVFIVPFEMSKEERHLYDGVSEFIREAIEIGGDEELPRWSFLLMVLQKEMGSSAYAATRTLERCHRLFAGTPLQRKHKRLVQLGQGVKEHTKLNGLVDLLREQADEKVLIFTQFRRTLEFIEARLKEEGIEAAVFHGSLSAAEKDRAVEAFRGPRRILISTEAGGEGRNLQFCRNVVNFDLPWNPMRIEQRIGRVHRLGQKRDTRIWNFTTRDTVEDYVLAILHRKVLMFELIIGEMDMVLGQWSDKDSFESEVFRIWSRIRNPEERRKKFEELGDDLSVASQRYERIKEFDDSIFSRLDVGGREEKLESAS